MDDASVFDRFLALARRELAASDVRILEHGEEPPTAPNAIVARMHDGRHVVASFAAEPKDKEALTRRLGMLADTFSEAMATPGSERVRTRPPVTSSLHEELKALSQRARAFDVAVIDVDSPMLWGCASVRTRPRVTSDQMLREVSQRELVSTPAESSPPPGLVALAPPPPSSATATDTRSTPPPDESTHLLSDPDDDEDEPELTRRALQAIRRLPLLDELHKGRHLRHVEREPNAYLVMSFSGIYLLCLVFEGEFDELRAERAAHESLPRIERLVLALPPLDPEPQPMGGVIAMRRPRRR